MCGIFKMMTKFCGVRLTIDEVNSYINDLKFFLHIETLNDKMNSYFLDFKEVLPKISTAIDECCFLAIDGEFTGTYIICIYLSNL